MGIKLKDLRVKFLDLSVYMMASLLPMVLSVIANPIIAKNMSPTDYAIVGYYSAFNSFITPLINFYLIHYYTKKYFELSKNERIELKSVIVQGLVYFSFLMAIFVLVGLYFYMIFFNANSDIPFSPYAIISVMSIPIAGIYTLNLVDYRMQRKSKNFFNLSVSYGIFALFLNILLVVVLKYGATGKLMSVLIANLVVFFFGIYSNKHSFSIKFNTKIFIEALKFCYPLILAAMLSFFSNGYDRVALERNGNIEELGYYVVGFQIAGYLHIFSTSIDNTFQADIFQSIAERKFKKCFFIILGKTVIVSFIVMFFILMAPFLVNILTAGRYVASTNYAIIISLSTISSVIYHSIS